MPIQLSVFNLTQEPGGQFIWNLTDTDLGPLGGDKASVKKFVYNVQYMALDFGATQELTRRATTAASGATKRKAAAARITCGGKKG